MGFTSTRTEGKDEIAAALAPAAQDSPEKGLSQDEAEARLARFGFNEISERRHSPILEFLSRYWGPMPWLLEAAMALSFLLGHYTEVAMIFALLSVNAVIGYSHAKGSRKAVDLLRRSLAVSVRVLRDGHWVSLPAREAVPGDVVAIKLGEVAPADGDILSGNISVDQSALTGESLPVELSQGGRIFSGSPIRRGEAHCLVTETGSSTYLGKTARLVENAKPTSHQEKVMLEIVRLMMYLGIAASVLVAGYAFALRMDPVVILTFVVIFLMGAIPVALPAVLTIVQSVGALELARKGAVVTRLEAIEDAASIDTLCFDKTGTITENRLAVADLWAAAGYEDADLLRMAALASTTEGKDLIDEAIMKRVDAQGIRLGDYVRVSYLPFDPLLKRTEATVEREGHRLRIAKGAPRVILDLCGAAGAAGSQAGAVVEGFSLMGYRSIAVAAADADAEGGVPRLAGVIALSDPPRSDSRAMIEEIKAAGIRPVMLTGDDEAIAARIAGAVGIGDRILRASDIAGLGKGDKIARIAGADGVAGIFPEDKFSIVRALQDEGHMVGMTGDGVNDAPALKQAEMGIAVFGSSDVAKAAAGIVLTEPGLAVIVRSIEISRQIYQRMLTWVINKITKVISFVGLLAVSFLWLKELPLSLLGMSLLVFANDFATMSLATDNVAQTPSPNRWEVGRITLAAVLPGLLFMAQGLGAIALGLRVFHLEMPQLGTLVLLNLIYGSQFRILIVRERGHFWESRPGTALLRTSAGVIIASSALGILGILVPAIAFFQAAAILAYSALCSLATDFPKVLSYRLFGLRPRA